MEAARGGQTNVFQKLIVKPWLSSMFGELAVLFVLSVGRTQIRHVGRGGPGGLALAARLGRDTLEIHS